MSEKENNCNNHDNQIQNRISRVFNRSDVNCPQFAYNDELSNPIFKSNIRDERNIESYDLSVVCINNNSDILNHFLLPSVRKQEGVCYELITIDNCDNAYNGARSVFNYVSNRLQGEYVMFVHNDFCFIESNALKKTVDFCRNLEPFGVLGVAGCTFDSKAKICTRIRQGVDKCELGTTIDEPISVMSVDECCFIVSKNQLMKQSFSDKEGWHLYAVEYCLQMIDQGLKNYVIPIDGWHYSDGVSMNVSYCKEIKELLDRNKGKYKYINTTVRQWKTNYYTRNIYLRYYSWKQIIKAMVRNRNIMRS